MKVYTYLKETIYAILPKKTLQKNEEFIRYTYVQLFYRGKTCQCNICTKQFSKFIVLDNGGLVCPYCGSLPRNRRLWQILKDQAFLKGNVLHFSPARSLYRKLKRLKHFGQEDHVRIYSVKGLIERLEKVGFLPEVLTFNKASISMGLKASENVILAYKTDL